MTNALERLADRAADDPYFLGYALGLYAESLGLPWQDLAAELGCTVETLPRLRLCRRPGVAGSPFREDILRIASAVGVDEGMLAGIVRYANALDTLRVGATRDKGTLMAARDRVEDPDDSMGRT